MRYALPNWLGIFGDRPADAKAEAELHLSAGATVRVGDRATELVCVRGKVWVTREGDDQDHVLRAGDVWKRPGDGVVVAQALTAGRLRVRGANGERVSRALVG